MPGVMTRVTSRRTMPGPLPGSSTCSQMATFRPCSTSFATYRRAEWYGTPHMGTLSAPLARAVSVICKSSEARVASS
jgi:hypothetical protein